MTQNVAGLGVSTIMMCLVFGTNALLFLFFYIIKASNKKQLIEEEGKKGGKQLSKPFLGTVDCFYNLTGELWRTGLILLLTYVCERHWIFDHSAKHYDRDLFMFVILVFFLYGLYTVKPNNDLALLGRAQTEEWKGWMQFIFLLYHYFHAEEVYNSVRVMITCYVWMTGFGNFSFFFVSHDFGWLRVVQMLWRLNFAVLLLMWTHGNTWILYYICPLHTFYFLSVYATMYVFSSVNTSKWGIRVKLMVVACIIYLVWDVNHGLFDKIFAFLGTDTVIGAGRGSVWEWYFRTSLDHWSTFLGMIFAVNFPLAEQYFVRAQGASLYVAAIILFGLFIWWYKSFFVLEKLEYNLVHSYTAIIPLLVYIFFRNITPSVRSYVSMSLHDLGKTTLETYLLQHHIWLSSNAKTLLTIVPDHPWVNFALTSLLFYAASKELFRLTMSLRGMLLPDNHQQAFQSIIALMVTAATSYSLAYLLDMVNCGFYHIALCCSVLFLVVLLLISRFAKKTTESPTYQHWASRFSMGTASVLVVFLFLIMSNGMPQRETESMTFASGSTLPIRKSAVLPTFQGHSPDCQSAIARGSWKYTPCHEPLPVSVNKDALCETYQWTWEKTPMPEYDGKRTDCPIGKISNARAKAVFKNKRVVFLGDSMVRQVFLEFVRLLDPKYKASNVLSPNTRHTDIVASIAASNTNVTFVWSPFVANITSYVSKQSVTTAPIPDYIVMGASAWDALHIRQLSAFSAGLASLEKELQARTVLGTSLANTPLLWIHPTTIVDRVLNTADKQKYMTEAIVSQYRDAVEASSLAKFIDSRGLVLNTSTVTQSMSEETVDGVHYGTDVYKVLSQMVANSFALRHPAVYEPIPFGTMKPQTPKVTGSMSFPWYGFYILVVTAIMLATMDSFLGVGYLSLVLFGKSLDWDIAYAPFLELAQRSRSKETAREAHATNAPLSPSAASAASGANATNGDVEQSTGNR